MGLFKKAKRAVADLKAVQEHALALAAAQSGAAQGQFDPSRFVPPPSAFVKRTKCGSCGAPKQLVSAHSHLYCDFCGELVDYDLRQAMAEAYMSPDMTAYAQQANQVMPAAMQARKAGDRERFRGLQYQLYELQAQYTPWAVPPRAWNDETYRQAWVAYNAEVAVATGFDPVFQKLESQMKRRALSLRYRGASMMNMATGAMKMEPTSLWPLIDVLIEQSARSQEVITASGLRDMDPDRMSPAVLARMAPSSIASAYLRFLEEDEGLELINRLGISHEFFQPEAVGERKNCGGCGGPLMLLPEARCIVCDGCGRRVDVGAGDLPCSGCGARMCLPAGVDHHNCPYCQAMVRRI